jgi:hypothetical protein
MSVNGFRSDELVSRKMNGQTRVFPVVGGRLRLAHEANDKLSLSTEMISWDGQYAVFRCSAETEKGCFGGYSTSKRNSPRGLRSDRGFLHQGEPSYDVKNKVRSSLWKI